MCTVFQSFIVQRNYSACLPRAKEEEEEQDSINTHIISRRLLLTDYTECICVASVADAAAAAAAPLAATGKWIMLLQRIPVVLHWMVED